MKKHIVTLLQGMVMGIAEIIPGVSGSTLAVIMGIYDDFLIILGQVSEVVRLTILALLRKAQIRDAWNMFKQINFPFAIVLGIGMLLSIALLSNLITHWLDNYPQYVYAAFCGLIIGAVYIPWGEIKNPGKKEFLVAVIFGALAFLIMSLKPAGAVSDPNVLFLFASGLIGITGMLLPGISGSFILLLIGVYPYIIAQIRNLTHFTFEATAITNLAVFAFGLAVGFLLFVRVLNWALTEHKNMLMAMIVGVMLGSLRALWPFLEVINPGEFVSKLPWELAVTDLLGIVVAFGGSILLVQLLQRLSIKS